jgi:hypothetical protein
MLALNAKGLPSATASKEAYLNAIEKLGFSAAHTALLEEAREWLLDHGHTPESAAGEGKLIHHAATYHAREAGVAVPERGAMCILLTNVFETQDYSIVAEERAEAANALNKFMLAAGISDPAEARRCYVEAAVEAAKDAASKQAGQAKLSPAGRPGPRPR